MKRIICFAAAFIMTIFTIGYNPSALTNVSVSAKAAILIDAQTGNIIYSKNSNTQLPMASTTKIMTTLLTLESGDLDTEFIIDGEALLTEGSSMCLCEGDAVTKRELCYGMMLPSGNDAANAAALKLAGNYEDFALMMNRRAGQIGMKNTNFVTPSGLHDPKHYSTAYDMALLTREALKNSDFREICKTKNLKLSSENWSSDKYLSNSNKLLSRYEYCIGVKTGFTDEAGRCLVSAAEKDGVTLICVTLNDPNDWLDHTNLLNYGFDCTKKTEIENIKTNFNVNAVGGEMSEIKCSLSEIPYCTAINSSLPDINEKIYLPKFVYAPIVKGDKVGYAEYYVDNDVICTVDIVSDENCSYIEKENKKSLYDSIIDWIKGFYKE